MSIPSGIQPALLSRINERKVLRSLQVYGPLSRAEVARQAGMSAPTASKAVEALLEAGLLEEKEETRGPGRGRPSRKLRLASETAQVLGIVIDAGTCRVVSAGLDGTLDEDRTVEFPTPLSYEALIETAGRHARRLMDREGVTTLGAGVSLPGLVDYRHERGVLSPNVPITNGRAPGRDLAERLGLPCTLIQEEHALCLAERHFGGARGIDDFAMLDVSTGVGLGVMSSGRLLTGHSGLAGEIGHITVQADGRPCGCGNQGCLETVACDSALAWLVSQRLGRKTTIGEVVELYRDGRVSLSMELDTIVRYLGIGIAAILNLFNPSTLFVHGRLFEIQEDLFARIMDEARRRALPPSYTDCRIVQARGSKRQGAVAAIIERRIDSLVPTQES